MTLCSTRQDWTLDYGAGSMKEDSSMAKTPNAGTRTAHELSIAGALLALLLFTQSVDRESGVKSCASTGFTG